MNRYDDYEHTKKHQEWVENNLPSWEEVSEAIERADAEHCKTLERETAVLQENKNNV